MLKKAGLVALAALSCCLVLYCAVVVLPEWHYWAKKPEYVAQAEMGVMVVIMEVLGEVSLEEAEAALLEEGFQKSRVAASRYEKREKERHSELVFGFVRHRTADDAKWTWRCYAIVPHTNRMFFADERDSQPTIWAADFDRTELEAVLAPEHPPLVAGGSWEAVRTFPARREEDSRDADRNRE